MSEIAAATADTSWSPRPALRRLRSLAADGLARLALRGVDHLGARPRVRGLPFVENLGAITIGDDLELHSGPVRSHLVTGPRGVLHIGNEVSIGAGAAIAAESHIEIGDGARLGPFAMLLDTDYHVAGDRTAPAPADPIVIGAHAWLGERVTVLRGAKIGRGAHIESGSVVSGTIPDGARAAGVPAQIIRPAEPPAPHATTTAPSDTFARIQHLAAEIFALPHLPAPTDGPATIPAWDSLGALRFLVSLEAELGIQLPPTALAGIHDLAGIRELVARAAR